MSRLLGPALALLLLSAGCGGDDTPTVTARSLETQLPQQIRQDDAGSRYTDVQCVPHGKNTFRCVGTYTPSQQAVVNTMRGIDTNDFTVDDWDALREQRTGPVSYEVVVDPTDGSWVRRPE